jgi:hypothetical protein
VLRSTVALRDMSFSFGVNGVIVVSA